MKRTAWLPHAHDEGFVADLRRRLDPAVQLVTGPDAPDPPDQQLLVAGRPTPEQLEASPDLRILLVPFAGIPPTTRDLLKKHPHLDVHNLHHNAAPTAELAIALLLAAAKKIVPMDAGLRRHDWTLRYEEDGGLLLDGKTALVLGLGAVGRRVARACAGLGMNVLATRRRGPSAKDAPPGVEVHGPEALADLLPRASAVLLCLPETAATRALLSRAQLERLPDRAILVNVGRGGLVDEEALFDALRERRLGAAGLDVWWTYPADRESRVATAPSRFPFHELDNVVLSPHRAGSCELTEALRAEHVARSLNALATGEPLPGRVDLDAGY